MSGYEQATNILLCGAAGKLEQETILSLNTSWKDLKVTIGVRGDVLKARHELLHLKIKSLVGLEPLQPGGVDPSIFQDIQAMVIFPPRKDRIQSTKVLVEAAKATGVEFLALVSHTAAASDGLILTEEFRRAEELVRCSGIPHAVLRSEFFMDNHLKDARSINATSTFSYPVHPDSLYNPVSCRDIGQALARVLVHNDLHRSKTYHLRGPGAFSMTELAEKYCKVLGREVKFLEEKQEDAVRDYQKRWGLEETEAKGWVQLWGLVDDEERKGGTWGGGGGRARGGNDVEVILKRRPETMHQFLERNKDKLELPL